MTVCAACGEWREAKHLLQVTDNRTRDVRYICRPTIKAACFASVRDRAIERIEAA